ncbi:cGMP-specific 3',5'-cyclic phosphodiesterase [Lepeophtheirus salmonis]|uniref:cGMP-specific 3',5'-cyclic phosphodiesterase n=1 Tax=Lepeophtheirus salmonis TaxID=72036 RepID=UPI003AF3503A
MDLILDISNELDINTLCHKILVNVGKLTNADRCSLFLARGPREKRYLEAKLFDVRTDTTLEEAMNHAHKEDICVPFGVGICGKVAKTKQTIHLRDAYDDPSFNRDIDYQTGYRTKSLVCMPICNYEGEVVGVAQIINKRENLDLQFDKEDLKIFERYLTFCGIGIQNAQLFEVSILEYKKNRLLLSLAKSLFQQQMSMENLVTTIITEAKEMLNCERSTIYLLDLKSYDVTEAVGGMYQPNLKSPSASSNSGVGGSEFSFTPHENEYAPLLCAGSNKAPIPDLMKGLHVEEIAFQYAWEIQNKSLVEYHQNDNELVNSRRARIAKYVASSREALNLGSLQTWLGDESCEVDGFIPKNMLCVPIFNGQGEVIGVAQLINKQKGNKFEESEVNLFEAFAIFCGIGIHNTKMYESACKLMAKQTVALDCLSYHASASDGDTESLYKTCIPSSKDFVIYSYKFNDALLSEDETLKIPIRMFMEFGFIQQFHIPYKVLCRWILSVKKNYRPVKYHNWRHALNVCQTMFTVLKTGKMDRFMDDLESLGLLVACLCHDLDHRGTNNAFQSKVDSPLANLYSTSTMEHHHFDQCIMILSSEGNNIFQGLNTENYKQVMKVVERAILSTDMALYFRKKDLFLDTADKGEFEWKEEDKKELLCGMLMTACDLSAIAKPWEQQHRIAKLVADEFFDQGDMEKLRLNVQPMGMMDRERKDELPQMQVEFIDSVCMPLYSSLSESFPWIKPLLDGCMSNREKWADLAEKVEMGLTWIDHDTIDKPIEELNADEAEAKDIEFKVEMLKPGGSINSVSSSSTTSLKKEGLSKKRSFRSGKSPHRSAGNSNNPTSTTSSTNAISTSFFSRRMSTKCKTKTKVHSGEEDEAFAAAIEGNKGQSKLKSSQSMEDESSDLSISIPDNSNRKSKIKLTNVL